MVTAVAVVAALALAVGTTGVLSFLTGQDSGFASSFGRLGSSLLWSAVGSSLLYFIVRKRSPRILVVTLAVLGGAFIVLAGTTTHGNLTGYLEYRNWIVGLVLCLHRDHGDTACPAHRHRESRIDRLTRVICRLQVNH